MPRLCSVDGCDRAGKLQRGLCNSHYARARRRGTLPPLVERDPVCAVDGCERATERREWCTMHYQRWQHHGDPLIVTRPEPPEVGVWRHVQKGPGCWLWTGAKTGTGYGNFRGRAAHRVVYEVVKGPVPEGLQLDHLCRVRNCVRPDHLEPVTCRENLLRGETVTARNAAKTHCPQGHPYDEANTYYRPGPNGKPHRRCLLCLRAQQKRTREKAAAARLEH